MLSRSLIQIFTFYVAKIDFFLSNFSPKNSLERRSYFHWYYQSSYWGLILSFISVNCYSSDCLANSSLGSSFPVIQLVISYCCLSLVVEKEACTAILFPWLWINLEGIRDLDRAEAPAFELRRFGRWVWGCRIILGLIGTRGLGS